MNIRKRANRHGTVYRLPDGRWQARTPRRVDGPPTRTRTSASRAHVEAWLVAELAAMSRDMDARLAAIEDQLRQIRDELRGGRS